MEPPGTMSGGVQMATESSADTTSRQDLLAEVVDDDDGRSSSLSEIDDDRLGSENMENMDFSPQKLASEIDSEAETERIEDSPHRMRNKASIVLSSTTYGTSPSKLAQSTTYDDLDDDDSECETSPSKPTLAAASNGIVDQPLGGENEKHSSLEAVNNKKRKRTTSLGDINELPPDDGPSRKRRGSLPLDPTSDDHALDVPSRLAVTEPAPTTSEVPENEIPTADDHQETETAADALLKAKKDKAVPTTKKGKRTRSKRGYTEGESNHAETNGNGITEEPQAEDEDNAEAADEADEAEVPSKLEESMRKTNAMDTLISLEQQFATLRDRIYDERIANLNRELAQLEKPNPTHPEFLRQLRIITEYRDNKIRHENTLFSYKLESLKTKCKAERSQLNSTYYQRVREVRESHLEKLSQEYSQVQQDRFQTPEASPDFSMPFPSRRSKQISQQTAYNTEVSVLSGFAKYVGFPASPAIQSTRRQELEEDFRSMGIRPAPQQAVEPTNDSHG